MREIVRRWRRRATVPITAGARALWRVRAELLTAAAFLVGWALLTHGVATLTAPVAWPLSAGLLCCSLGGWRLLWTIVTQGLYVLTRSAGGPRG